ncbi:MAG: preprotein translocase subunit SecE [Clostridia bacterium]|nr:preprotein translocase subunit SecE [Clostridia bacterium]MBP5269913.1 preprotein translocase subunit SecE [Clostridia bacterium]
MKPVSFKRLAVLLLALALVFTLASVPAFADGEDTAADGSESTLTTGTEGEDTAAEGSESTLTTGTDDGDTDSDDASTPVTTTGDETSAEINWDLIITLSVIGLAVIVFFIFFFANKKFNARVKKFIKEISSELKKVVWSPWRDVKKNTVIVLVVSLGAALLIFILDMLFSKGLSALTTLVRS